MKRITIGTVLSANVNASNSNVYRTFLGTTIVVSASAPWSKTLAYSMSTLIHLAVAADLVNKLRIARVDSIGTQVFANVRAYQSAVTVIIHGFSKNVDVYAF